MGLPQIFPGIIFVCGCVSSCFITFLRYLNDGHLCDLLLRLLDHLQWVEEGSTHASDTWESTRRDPLRFKGCTCSRLGIHIRLRILLAVN